MTTVECQGDEEEKTVQDIDEAERKRKLSGTCNFKRWSFQNTFCYLYQIVKTLLKSIEIVHHSLKVKSLWSV